MTQPEDRPIEVPEADAAEQARYADPSEFEEPDTPSTSIEAPEWDALEQTRAVPVEDDYR